MTEEEFKTLTSNVSVIYREVEYTISHIDLKKGMIHLKFEKTILHFSKCDLPSLEFFRDKYHALQNAYDSRYKRCSQLEREVAQLKNRIQDSTQSIQLNIELEDRFYSACEKVFINKINDLGREEEQNKAEIKHIIKSVAMFMTEYSIFTNLNHSK